MLFKPIKSAVTYLVKAPETAVVRPRAYACAALLCIGCPAALLMVPIPIGIQVPGVVVAQKATIVRADTNGIVVQVAAHQGGLVQTGDLLLRMKNLDSETASQTLIHQAKSLDLEARRQFREDRLKGSKLTLEAVTLKRQASEQEKDVVALSIRAPQDGRLVEILPAEALGTFLTTGTPVAKVVSGHVQIRGWLTTEQLVSAETEVGTSVDVYFADANTVIRGKILSLAPATAGEFQDLAVSTVGNGEIPIDPITGNTQQALFELIVEIPDRHSLRTLQDARARILIGRRHETLFTWTWRRCLTFVHNTLSY